MGRLVSLCRVPSPESSSDVQEGTKRGVRIGEMSFRVGSSESQWAVVALVSSIAEAGEASL